LWWYHTASTYCQSVKVKGRCIF